MSDITPSFVQHALTAAHAFNSPRRKPGVASRALLSLALTLSLLVLHTSRAAAQDYKAITLDSAALLRVPDELKDKAGSAFEVAAKAPRVDFIRLTDLPDKGKGTLWSTWGDGCLASNGRYYTSIGDHMGNDATSHVYEYDPETRRLRLVLDIAKAIGQKPGQYGHGKIHSGIHEGPDGWLWFSTYWGKHREVDKAFGDEYQGSILMRFEPATGKVENLGAIVPRQGLPASHYVPQNGLLCFYAVYESNLVVYDLAAQKRVFLGGAQTIAGNRALMHDQRGRVYFSGQDGHLHYYDPQSNRIARSKAKLADLSGASTNTSAEKKSDNTLRAAIAAPTPDGMLYGMSAAGRLFSFNPQSESLQDLGPNFGEGLYTAVMVADPSGRQLYYLPGAHGSAAKVGAPLVKYDIATGQRTVLAFLESTLREKSVYQLGGTYNLQLDPTGKRLFTTINGAPAKDSGKVETFGEPCVIVVHLAD